MPPTTELLKCVAFIHYIGLVVCAKCVRRPCHEQIVGAYSTDRVVLIFIYPDDSVHHAASILWHIITSLSMTHQSMFPLPLREITRAIWPVLPRFLINAQSFKSRLHQDNRLPGNMCPGGATCIRIHICWQTHVVGYKLLVRDTCWLYLGDITIHLCQGRLVSLCIQQQTLRQTSTILLSIQERCWRNWMKLVSSNMCPGVNAALRWRRRPSVGHPQYRNTVITRKHGRWWPTVDWTHHQNTA